MQIKKLKNKIVIFVVAIIVLVGLSSTYFVASYAKKAVIASKKEEIKIELENVSKKIDAFFVEQNRYLEIIAGQEVLINAFEQGGNLQENRELSVLIAGLGAKGLQEQFLVLDLDGNVLASNVEDFLGKNFSYRDYFIQGLENNKGLEVVIGSITKKRVLVFSRTVHTRDGQLLGLIVQTINIDAISGFLTDNLESIDSKNHIQMLLDDNAVVIKSSNVSYENKVIAQSDEASFSKVKSSKRYGDVELSTLQYPDLLAAVSSDVNIGVYEIFDKEDNEKELVGISKIASFPFYVAIELREINYLETIRSVYYNIGVAVFTLGLIALMCVYYFVSRFLRPLKQLKNAAEKIGQGNFDFSLSVKSGDEFQDLADAFNIMSQSLLKSKHDIEVRVQDQTSDINEQRKELENQKRAALNILEDVAFEKERSDAIIRFLKSIGDGVIAVDLNKKIIFFNDAAEKMIGISSQQALGKEISSVVQIFAEKDEDLTDNVLLKELASDLHSRVATEHYSLKKDEKLSMSISMNVAHIIDTQNEKQGHIIVLRDVTEERTIEKTKDEFLSVAAHQLRTPLTGIRWSLEMLADGDVGKLTKDAKQLVGQMLENNQRLTVLVNDLLDVSRINMGKAGEEVVTKRDVVHSVDKAIKTLSGFASERGVEVSMKKSTVQDVFVNIGHKHFFQALENLISNAIKYTPKGGKVVASVDVKKDKVIIAIKDNGIGIPEKDQKNIFSKFFRATNAVSKDTEGSGLGLNVVKSYIEEAGGKVWFESEEGKGTTFFIEMNLV